MESGAIGWLTFFTLGAGIVIIAGAFIYFLRSRHNRYVAEQTLVGDGKSHPGSTPDGALPELIGFFVLALIIMGLLGFGFGMR